MFLCDDDGEGCSVTFSDDDYALNNKAENGITDEFIKPIVSVDEKGNPVARIKDGDAVICFNFRTDRCREILSALSQKDMAEYEMKKLNLHFTTMTNYDSTFSNVNVIFEKHLMQLF